LQFNEFIHLTNLTSSLNDECVDGAASGW